MKNLLKILVLALVLVSIGFVGCKKEIGEPEENNINTNETIEVQIVTNQVFKYPIQKYDNLGFMLKSLDNKNLKSDNNFYSLYDYYKEAQIVFDSLGIDGLKEKGFDLNYFSYDTSGIFELNIFDEELAKNLSPEGFTQFGDTIMKVSPDNLIYIYNGDYNLVTEVKKKDFSSTNIHVNDSKSFPIVQVDHYYDNGWGEACHRIYLKRWYRNYQYYVRVGVSISYYTRIYKREWALGKKRLVWIKKDKANLYVHETCDSMSAIVLWNNGVVGRYTYNTKNLFEKSRYCNHMSMSKNPIDLSLSFWANDWISNFTIYNFKMSYETPIKNGLL